MPKPAPTVAELLAGIRQRSLSHLGQAVTLLESTLPSHQSLAAELLEACLPFSGQSFRIGITGSPGVGKSTFIEHWGLRLANKGKRIAVLTIDPSSQRTGGSILGDKTRMNALSAHPSAFVRPSPAGKALGGVNWRTREAILVCEAAGYDTIVVETVGVGQNETAVSQMVDFFLLLLLPSGGDSLQGIKRGIMELADGILVTKADESPEQARRTVQDYRAALHLTLPNSDSGWGPFVMPCASVTGFQLDQVDEYLANYEALTKANGAWAKRRAQQQLDWFADLVQQELRQQFFTQGTRLEEVAQLEEAISAGALSPLRALRILFGKA